MGQILHDALLEDPVKNGNPCQNIVKGAASVKGDLHCKIRIHLLKTCEKTLPCHDPIALFSPVNGGDNLVPENHLLDGLLDSCALSAAACPDNKKNGRLGHILAREILLSDMGPVDLGDDLLKLHGHVDIGEFPVKDCEKILLFLAGELIFKDPVP